MDTAYTAISSLLPGPAPVWLAAFVLILSLGLTGALGRIVLYTESRLASIDRRRLPSLQENR